MYFVIILLMSLSQEIDNYLKNNGFNKFTPKVVLFDMDGVLYDSMPNHAICWKEAMAEYGIDMPESATYKYEGMRGVETIQLVAKQQLGKIVSDADAQKMYDEKTRLFGLLPEAPIMKGVKPLMAKIKASGVRIGVVTGSGQRPLIQRLLDDFKDLVDEHDIVTAYDVKHGKPSPEPYLMGLKKAGFEHPWEGIVVENAPLGVRAGVAAKIFTVAVNSGPLPDEALAKEGANIILSKMIELCDLWNDFMKSF